MSQSVRAIFADESPMVQPVSIDEAYLDVTPGRFTAEHPVTIARRIRARVAELGITCSVGVSAVKSVAKIASDHDKPDGLTVVCRVKRRRFSRRCRFARCLASDPEPPSVVALGIRTLGELAALDDLTASECWAATASDSSPARGARRPRRARERAAKSVSNERTFATDVREIADVDGALAALAAKVGQRVRRGGQAGRTSR